MRQQMTKMEFIYLLRRQFQTQIVCSYLLCCALAKNAARVSREMARQMARQMAPFVLKIAHFIWLFQWNQSQ